jgi:hypothetical protein
MAGGLFLLRRLKISFSELIIKQSAGGKDAKLSIRTIIPAKHKFFEE